MRWGAGELTVHVESTAIDARAVHAQVFDVLGPPAPHGPVATRTTTGVHRVPPVAAPGEDVWIPPAEWRRSAGPFRGSGSLFAVVPPTSTIPKVIGVPEPDIGDVFPTGLHWNLTVHPPESVVEPPALSPLGLAMFHALVSPEPWIGDPVEQEVDAWIAHYGLPTACEAATRLLGLRPEGRVEAGCVTMSQQATQMCDDHPGIAGWMPVLTRVREHLAVAGQVDYDEAVEWLAAVRERSNWLWAQIATAYLVPERQDWVDEALRHTPRHESGLTPYLFLGHSIEARAQLDRLLAVCDTLVVEACLPSLVDRLAPEAAAAMSELLDEKIGRTPPRSSPSFGVTAEQLAALLAMMPTDEAFELLLDRVDHELIYDAVRRAASRLPRRAARLISRRVASVPAPILESVLRSHIRAHPELATEAGLAPEDIDANLPIATPDELPSILAVPPWTGARRRRRPPMRGLGHKRPLSLRWVPGERAEWADSTSTVPFRRLLGTFEEEALDDVMRAAAERPIAMAATLAPVDGTDATELMLDVLIKTRASAVARTWFERHADSALNDLIPLALGTSRRRVVAETALRMLYDRGHASAITATAAEYGKQAAAAVGHIVRLDRNLVPPPRIPSVPHWLDLDRLPRIRLRDRHAAFHTTAVCALVRMLRMCSPGADYPGIATALVAADPTSLAEFGREMFDAWRAEDSPDHHAGPRTPRHCSVTTRPPADSAH